MSDITPAVDGSVAAVDRALLYLRRRMNPRGMRRIRQPGHCAPTHIESIPLLYAIAEDEGEITVGRVAEWMCIDPSRASRMVTASIEAGFVTRLASAADGRRTVLELTDAGRALLAETERYRQEHFQRVMAGWSERERGEFARLLVKFSDGLDTTV